MKTVVITGASRGIGKAAALLFLKRGWQVIGVYLRSDDAAEELRQAGAVMYRADVSVRGEVFALCDDILRDFSHADVLVNNAGCAAQRLFSDISEEEYRRMMKNADSAFFCSQAFSRDMIRRHSGKIINISSMWGQVGASCEVDYSMSKAAILGLTRALAKELGPSGITVNAVAPGVILTDMTAPLGRETLDELAEETPLSRNGTPEDVANAVYFLASDEAGFITGQTLGVNGGFVIL